MVLSDSRMNARSLRLSPSLVLQPLISGQPDALSRGGPGRQHGQWPHTVLRLFFQLELQAQHPLILGQALFQCFDLVPVADQVLAIALEEITDRLDAN